MDASCGPGNALSQLSKHTQKDISLQYEHSGIPEHNGLTSHTGHQHAFRNGPGLDNNLNQEFQQFRNGGPTFQPETLNSGPYGGQHVPQQNLQMGGGNTQPYMGRNHGWVQDFSELSLHGMHNNMPRVHHNQAASQQPYQKPGSAHKAEWHQQFMESMRQQKHQIPNQQQYQPIMGQMNQMGYANQAQFQHQHQNQSNNLHDLHLDEIALSRSFDMIEKELEQECHGTETMEKTSPKTPDNEALADAARQIQASMMAQNVQHSQETAQKFQSSSFLKLMTQISEKKVELSQDGNKFISTSTGADIREFLSDPLRHERVSEDAPTYHAPQHDYYPQAYRGFEPRTTNESENIRSHLPDPLAHIKNGELNGDLSSFETAKVISGGQVQNHSWMEDEMWDAIGGPSVQNKPSLLSPQEQEVYDDYRNNDT